MIYQNLFNINQENEENQEKQEEIVIEEEH